VMNGFRAELIDRVIGMNGHLDVYSLSKALPQYEKLTDEIKKLPCITDANPRVEGQAMATAHNNASGVVVHGMNMSDLQARKTISDNIVRGEIHLFDHP